MCDRSHLASDQSEERKKCSLCKKRRPDCVHWTGTTDIGGDDYRVIIVTVCPQCRRNPDVVDAKLRRWAKRLRDEADVLDSFRKSEAAP
jgi:hypothetical protein